MSNPIRRMKALRHNVMLFALSVAAGLTAVAGAQFGKAAGFTNLMRQDYLRRDLQLIEQGLELDDGQRVIVESFYEDYVDSFQQGLENMRNEFKEMKDKLQSQDRDRVLKLVFQPFSNWQQQKRDLKQEFENNIKLILNERQLEMWPSFEKMMLREKELPRGEFDGETLNLFHVIRDMDLEKPEKDAIQSVVDQYAQELHQALLNREQTMRDSRDEVVMSLQSRDGEQGLKMIRKQIEARKRVRGVNLRYIDTIAAAMPTDKLTKQFRESALEEAFPRVYRPTVAERLFKAAKELDDLTEEQQQSVVDFEAKMLSDLSSIRDELKNAILEYQPKEEINRAERYAARLSDGEADRIQNPTQSLLRKRNDVGKKYALKLRDILTPEVFAKLPGSSRIVPDRTGSAAARMKMRKAGKRDSGKQPHLHGGRGDSKAGKRRPSRGRGGKEREGRESGGKR